MVFIWINPQSGVSIEVTPAYEKLPVCKVVFPFFKCFVEVNTGAAYVEPITNESSLGMMVMKVQCFPVK